MRAVLKGEPCRNFSFMKSLYLEQDPLDGKEKLVLSNYAAEGLGCILILDPHTGVCEQYPFPDDAGAWGLLWLPERGELLVGTCDHQGSLHSFNMAQRSFVSSRRLPEEMYLWNFALGGDGCVYAGTYPGCVLARYDPDTRELTSLGRVGTCAENQYSRFVHERKAGGRDLPELRLFRRGLQSSAVSSDGHGAAESLSGRQNAEFQWRGRFLSCL